jgi:ATP-dependent DNA helicase RecG
LKQNESLTLDDCILLDAVQKKHKISEQDAKSLAVKGLIEGKYPEIYLSESVSRSTGQLGDYVKNRGMKRQYYKDMVISFLEKNPSGVTRKEIDDFLLDMIPKSSKNPVSYIGNLLYDMQKKDRTIIYFNELWHQIDGK